MHALNDIILGYGLISITIVIFIESGFPIGFFLPGDTLLFAAGLFAAKGSYPLWLALVAIFVSNFLGVTIGYFMGKSLGKRWLKKERGFIFRHEYVEKATEFYEQHGGKAIILGRFIPAVRAFVPMVAGVANMEYRKLMFYNAIGAALWTLSITLVGYFAGAWLESKGINIETLVLPIILLIIVVSFAAPVVHALSNKGTRAALKAKITHIFKK